MLTSITEFVEAARHLTPAEQREILARLLSEPPINKANTIWHFVRFSEKLRVVSYAPGQEQYVGKLQQLLQQGVFARLENEADGNYEIYGTCRTYYVVMTPQREFAAILSSWPIDHPPHEIILKDK